MIEKELIIILLGCLILGFFLWRQDKKKKEQDLSDRLHNVENNVTQLTNVNYLKNRQSKK